MHPAAASAAASAAPQIVKIIGIGLLGIGVILTIVILKKFVFKSEEDKKRDQLVDEKALQGDTIFEKDLMKLAVKKMGIKDGQKPTKAQLKKVIPHIDEMHKYANQIYKSDGMNDNERHVFGAFRTMSSVFECAYLSKLFQMTYKEDMFSYLDDFLDNNEMATVYDIIKKKPKV